VVKKQGKTSGGCIRGVNKGDSLPRMAPNLAESQHAAIGDMIHSESFKVNEIAEVADCCTRSIYAINKNFRCFGSTKAPSNGVPSGAHTSD
jgi:hypothetical protein